MNAVGEWLGQPVVQRAGWALVHFVWEGAVVAAVLAAVLAALRRRSPNARYLAACAALAVMALAAFGTFVALDRPRSAGGVTVIEETAAVGARSRAESALTPIAKREYSRPAASSKPAMAEVAIPRPPKRPWKDRAVAMIEGNLRWFVLAWGAGVLALSSRLLVGLARVRGLARRGARPLSEGLQSAGRRLAERLGIRRSIRWIESGLARTPMAVGWLKPAILVPTAAILNLSPHQLEAILAHELAHIRRHDYLVNLLQSVVETLLFYHPAVHWVSRRIRVERELCCDDVVVSACGDTLGYARALAALAETQASFTPAPAATSGALFDRVRRLLGIEPERDHRPSRWVAGAITMIVIMVFGLCLWVSRASGQAQAKVLTANDPVVKSYEEMIRYYPDDEKPRLPTDEELKLLSPLWPSVPARDNATYYLVKGWRDLDPGEGPKGSTCNVEPYDGNLEAFRTWVDANRRGLVTAREGLLRDYCQMPAFLSIKDGDVTSAMLPFFAKPRLLARVLTDEGWLAELLGKPDEAALSYLDCVRMSVLCRSRSVLIGHQVGMAVNQIGARSLERLIANADPSEATLFAIIRCCEKAQTSREELLRTWELETAYGRMVSMQQKTPPFLRLQYEAGWKKIDGLLRRSDVDLFQARIQEELLRTDPSEATGFLAAHERVFQRWIQSIGRLDVELRAIEVRAAISIHRKRNGGKLPERLGDLTPGILAAVPMDPFSRKPMRYARTADGWKMWSVGPDNVDDGGKGNVGRRYNDADILFVSDTPSNVRIPGKKSAGGHLLQIRLVSHSESKKGETMKVAGGDRTLDVLPEELLSEEHVRAAGAQPQRGAGGQVAWAVELHLTDEGRERMADVTEQNVGRQLALTYIGEILSAPVIRSRIAGPTFQIGGSMDEARAREIAAALSRAISLRAESATLNEPGKGAATEDKPPKGTARVDGVAYDTKGQPLANRSVRIQPKAPDPRKRTGRATSTDAEGRFSFKGLKPGEYKVQCDGVTLLVTPANIALGRDESKTIVLRPGTGSVAGQVRGLDVDMTSVIVVIRSLDPQCPWFGVGQVATAAVLPDKTAFSFPNLAEGRYELQLRSTEKPGTLTTSREQSVRVEAGRETTAVIDAPHSTITGEVMDARTKAPVAKAVVGFAVAMPDGSATTNENGRFVLSHLTDGKHEVVVSHPGHCPARREIVIEKNGQAVSCSFSLSDERGGLIVSPAPEPRPEFAKAFGQQAMFMCALPAETAAARPDLPRMYSPSEFPEDGSSRAADLPAVPLHVLAMQVGIEDMFDQRLAFFPNLAIRAGKTVKLSVEFPATPPVEIVWTDDKGRVMDSDECRDLKSRLIMPGGHALEVPAPVLFTGVRYRLPTGAYRLEMDCPGFEAGRVEFAVRPDGPPQKATVVLRRKPLVGDAAPATKVGLPTGG